MNAGAGFAVEWSDTLSGPASWSSSGVTGQILTDDGTIQTVRAIVPTGSGGRRFVHLEIVPPP